MEQPGASQRAATSMNSKKWLGQCGLLACAVGAVAGAVASASGFASSQAAVSLVAALLLAGLNAVPVDASAMPWLPVGCGCLGLFLGYGAGAAARIVMTGDAQASCAIPLFLMLVSLFHVAEFAFVAAFHPADTKFDSMMMRPVPAGGYSIAMIAALVEYWSLKGFWSWTALPTIVGSVRGAVLVIGFTLCAGGWALRTAALFTAQSNFTHLVARRKKEGHTLVTGGVYRLCRHPSYTGWFLWSVSTQLILGNPCCFVAYTYVSWWFFATRIPDEEALLVSFFGQQYLSYASRVPCRLPGISNLKVSD